jgi:CRP-like cAMP-binding protein
MRSLQLHLAPDDDCREQVLDHWAQRVGEHRQLRSGARVVAHGDPARFVAYVRRGRMLLQRAERNGVTVAIATAEAGAMVGLAATLRHTLHVATGVMATAGEVVTIPRACVVEGFACPTIGPPLVSQLAQECLRLADRCATLAALPVRERVVDALREATRDARLPARAEMTTTDLARLVGADVSHVRRVLRELKRDGVVDYARSRIAVLQQGPEHPAPCAIASASRVCQRW